MQRKLIHVEIVGTSYGLSSSRRAPDALHPSVTNLGHYLTYLHFIIIFVYTCNFTSTIVPRYRCWKILQLGDISFMFPFDVKLNPSSSNLYSSYWSLFRGREGKHTLTYLSLDLWHFFLFFFKSFSMQTETLVSKAASCTAVPTLFMITYPWKSVHNTGWIIYFMAMISLLFMVYGCANVFSFYVVHVWLFQGEVCLVLDICCWYLLSWFWSYNCSWSSKLVDFTCK